MSFGAVEGSDRDLKMIPIHREEIVLCVPAFHKLAEFREPGCGPGRPESAWRSSRTAPSCRSTAPQPWADHGAGAEAGGVPPGGGVSLGECPSLCTGSSARGAGVGLIPWLRGRAQPGGGLLPAGESGLHDRRGGFFRKDHAPHPGGRGISYTCGSSGTTRGWRTL